MSGSQLVTPAGTLTERSADLRNVEADVRRILRAVRL
jgi:hypothetical protein